MTNKQLTGKSRTGDIMIFRHLPTLVGLILLVLLGLIPAAQAHPHVFIDYRLHLRQQKGHIQGFELVWTLDSENSELVMTEFDTNADGQLDSSEAAGAAAQMVQDMSEYSFFTEVSLDGRALPITGVQQIDARFEQNRMVYQLFLPCDIAPSAGAHTLSFKAIDPTNYVAFKPNGVDTGINVRDAQNLHVLQPARQTYDAWLFQLGGN